VSERQTALLVFVLALLPRIWPAGHVVTVDEAYHWFARAERFLQAVQQGDYAATNLIGHPGVTTMWLGSLGLLLQQAAAGVGWLPPAEAATPALLHTAMRMPVGAAIALCLALCYPLLRRLFGGGLALLAALFWAFDPFLVAHSRLLHVDGLLTACMALALLAALVGCGLGDTRRLSWALLAGSGAAGGLALLTKSPSVLLLPMVGLIALVGLLRLHSSDDAAGRAWWRALPRVLPRWLLVCAMWGGVAALVWLALWPAAWVDPAGAVERVLIQVLYEGGTPHGWGNFFLGQPVDDPGPRFYPAALVLRLTPWGLVGLLLLALPARSQPAPQRSALLLLLAFVLLCLLTLSLPPKKFDRYVLPLFPMLNILAAAGWLRLAALQAHRFPALAHLTTRTRALLVAALLALLAGQVVWYHPYTLAYYNPLLGGGSVAARVLPVGWGEGLEQAGAYIQAQPNGCDYPLATWYVPVLELAACSPVLRLDAAAPGRVGYAVLYIDQVQRNNAPAVTAELLARPPLHTVRLHGIDYARIYQLPLPLPERSQARFGEQIRLHSYELDSSALAASGTLTLTTQWQALATHTSSASAEPPASLERDYQLFVHVLDAQGQRVAQIDVPPGGPRAPTSRWQPGQYITWYHPLPLDSTQLAADEPQRYWLALGLYDPQSGARLPLHLPPTAEPVAPPPASESGTDALLLPVRLP
jgi:hypothetical protein